MPKPKNDGAVLSVRIPHEVHAAVHKIQAMCLETAGLKLTAGDVVSDALRLYYGEFRRKLGKVDKEKLESWLPPYETLLPKVEA